MITAAVQQENLVYAYHGSRVLFSQPGTLMGYTASTVSIQREQRIYVYDEAGRQIVSRSAENTVQVFYYSKKIP